MKEGTNVLCDSLNCIAICRVVVECKDTLGRTATASYYAGHKSNRLAENLGAKNAKWDKKDGYETAGADIYNSYIYLPEDDTLSIQEKFRLHGQNYTGYCDGGSALHVNLKEHLTYEQYKFLMKYAIKCGTSYYTYNVPSTECLDCGNISKHFVTKCPKCGSEHLDYATRIIGYCTKISKWSPERQAEFKRRYFADGLKQEENE